MLVLTLLAIGTVAGAEPRFTIRMATVAPDNTFWAREFKAFARDVETFTHGEVNIKWYFGGIAGDEAEVRERIGRDQMDGMASGGMVCHQVAPMMRVLQIPGVFQNREEAAEIIHRLRPSIEEEAKHNGFVLTATTGLGPAVIFSRTPISSMAELKKTPLWLWNLDDVTVLMAREMGLHIVATPIAEARSAYDQGKLDGFLAIPAAALAFQWSAQARYITDLRIGFLMGCILITNRTFDRLPIDDQEYIRSQLAKMDLRFEEIGTRQDNLLLGGLLQKQGLKPLPVSETFRSGFFLAARAARERLGNKLVPAALLDRVLRMLADYRAEHR
jgi:TRAP-type C4-dicarboxylate transport system substrate-binding protein